MSHSQRFCDTTLFATNGSSRAIALRAMLYAAVAVLSQPIGIAKSAEKFEAVNALEGLRGALHFQAKIMDHSTIQQVVPTDTAMHQIQLSRPPATQGVPLVPIPMSPCTNAATAFYIDYKRLGFPGDNLTDLAAAYGDPKYRQDALSYKSACFVPFPTAPSPFGGAERSVGIFISPGASPYGFCTGFVIKPDEVMTARHCFYDVATNTRIDGRGSANFVLFSAPANALAISGFVTPDMPSSLVSGPIKPLNDFVIVRLANPSPGPPVTAGAAAVDVASEMPGLMTYVPGSWQMQVSWTSPNSACMIVEKTNTDCLVHLCQASPGSSGAPIFQRTASGQIVVVGMHLAPSGQQGCNADTAVANIAIPVAGLF